MCDVKYINIKCHIKYTLCRIFRNLPKFHLYQIVFIYFHYTAGFHLHVHTCSSDQFTKCNFLLPTYQNKSANFTGKWVATSFRDCTCYNNLAINADAIQRCSNIQFAFVKIGKVLLCDTATYL